MQSALVEALKASPTAVPLMDRTDLEPGDMWRARINLWVGGCDAAVILLSNKALASAWVSYEAALLSYRAKRDTSFLLIPVYVGVSPKQVEESPLHPILPTEIQAIQAAGRSTKYIVTKVLKRLDKAVCLGNTPVERRARRLARLLDLFKENHLREAAAFIHYDLKPWLPADDAQLLLAVQLQSVGMKAAVPALLSLETNLPANMSGQEKADWLQKVVDLVASSWVDQPAIECIPLIAKGETSHCSVGLNATDPRTATMYVLCSCTEEPKPWKLVMCDGVVGQDSVEQTIKALSSKVAKALIEGLILKCKPEDLTAVLERRSAFYPRPVFVSLPGEGISAEILHGLRRAFPRVTFFVLMGEAMGEPLSDMVLKILFPHLVSGDEAIFLDTYEKFRENVSLP